MEFKDYLKQLIINEWSTPEFKKLVNLVDEQTDFFTAPASTKYHLVFEGGLAIHTLEVIKTIKQCCESGMWDLDMDSAIKCAFLHDLCKTGYYTLNPDGTYSYNKNINGHGNRSVEIALLLGITLTDKEKAMIEFHMGSFAPAGTTSHVESISNLDEAKIRLNKIADYQKLYTFNVYKYPEILAMHCSDYYASVKEQYITKEAILKDFKEYVLNKQGKVTVKPNR